jgi:DNA mismatch repair protein MutL
MLVVDQHAFHERVLYERLKLNPGLLKSSQPLLMPEVLAFAPSEIVDLAAKRDHYAQLGLVYSILNEREIEVQSVPSLLMNRDLSTVLQALLQGAEESTEILHDHLATIACHAAVRAGEELPDPELKCLMREAHTVDFYHNCPHGRRVFRWWKLSQVAAWFDRLGG